MAPECTLLRLGKTAIALQQGSQTDVVFQTRCAVDMARYGYATVARQQLEPVAEPGSGVLVPALHPTTPCRTVAGAS